MRDVCRELPVGIITDVLTYLLMYLFTNSMQHRLEKLTSFQLVKKILAFYVTQGFITTFTISLQMSLYWAPVGIFRVFHDLWTLLQEVIS